MFSGKKVLLGVTGSIAAYKSTYLTRLLIKAGAEVKVVLTPAARDFVTPLSLSTLSKNPVFWEYFDPDDEKGEWNNHVAMALWADLMIIAPATANTLSKMASGASDNFLMGIYLSAKCPVYFAPAMDLDMYRHPSTRENIQKLVSYGNRCIPSGTGELASGLEGEGRMAEPEEVMSYIFDDLCASQPLLGKKILINGGPTQEPIDPVRFVGNRSSGKMGVALAEAALAKGAAVTLVLGPGTVRPESKDIEVIDIQTALEMQEICMSKFEDADIAVLSAAIADYRPEESSANKIKKNGGGLEMRFVENPDILAGLGAVKRNDQILVGFALETDNGIINAQKKLHTKKCDMIVLNTPSERGTGFGYDTNEVTLIPRRGEITKLNLKNKREIADEIFDFIILELL